MFTLHPTTKIFRQSFRFQNIVAKEVLAKDNLLAWAQRDDEFRH
jgi:hypothetical protein